MTEKPQPKTEAWDNPPIKRVRVLEKTESEELLKKTEAEPKSLTKNKEEYWINRLGDGSYILSIANSGVGTKIADVTDQVDFFIREKNAQWHAKIREIVEKTNAQLEYYANQKLNYPVEPALQTREDKEKLSLFEIKFEELNRWKTALEELIAEK